MIIYFCLFYIWPVKNLEQIGKITGRDITNAAVSFCTSFRTSTCIHVMSSEGECEAPFRCLHEIFETVHSHNTYASKATATTVGVSGASSMLVLVLCFSQEKSKMSAVTKRPVSRCFCFFILEMYKKITV